MATYKSRTFPSFFSSKSSYSSPNIISNIEEGAALIKANLEFNQTNGIILAVPIPEEHSIDHESIETVIEQALSEYGYRMGYGSAIATVLFGIMLVYITFFIYRMYRDEQRGL